MILWLDNHLSPRLAAWIGATYSMECRHVRDLGLASATDREIQTLARAAGAHIMTKDRDFAHLLAQFGAPPAIIILTMGNTSTAHLQTALAPSMQSVLAMLAEGAKLIQIGPP